jgi:signal peptidase II
VTDNDSPDDTGGMSSAASAAVAARRSRMRRRSLVAAAAVTAAGLDLTAKVVADARLSGTSIDLGVIQLQLAHNPGVAFSVGAALPTWLVLAVTATITAAIAVYAWRAAPTASRVQRLVGGVILGGAVANLLDRAGDGVVTDYLHTGWFPTFNLADVVLTVGAALFVLTNLRTPHQQSSPSPDAPPQNDTPRTRP